jgi:hypothetical protein
VASTPPTVPCPVTSPPASHQALGSIPQASPPRDCSCTLPWTRRFDASMAPRALPRSPHTRTSSRPVRHTTVHGIEPPSRNHPRPGPASFGPTPGEPEFRPNRTESSPVPTGTPSHRHRLLAPWTNRTMPLPSAAHETQSSPTQAHHSTSLHLQIKGRCPLWKPPLALILPTPFLLHLPELTDT